METSKCYDCVYWYSGGWALGTWRAVFGVDDLEACAEDLRRQGYCTRYGRLSVGPPDGVPEELEHATDAVERVEEASASCGVDELRNALRQALATIDCAIGRGKRSGATADDVLRVLATVNVKGSLACAPGAERAPVRIDEEGNDLDHKGITWSHYEVDAFTRECECEGPECDPDTCPRLSDTCEECGATFSSGWVCLDGGECACDECVTVFEIPEGGAS